MIDEAEIIIQAGRGGDGAVSFRREKFVPKGGPDGGNGGNGGSIILKTNSSVAALTNFARQKEYEAEDGAPGQKARKDGKYGRNLILEVPIGTQIYEIDKSKKTLLFDMKKSGEFLAAKGGKGGLGNSNYATSTNQTPRYAQPGQEGQKRLILLQLKLLADIGIIGLANSGKSTLLSRLTKAKPKIGNYPFTTLRPNLGVLRLPQKSFVLADIPGLIEGASKGKGLGIKFLKHIERTQILIHLIEPFSANLLKNYALVRHELKSFNPKILKKKEIVAISKADALTPERKTEISRELESLSPIFISSASGIGLNILIKKIQNK